MDGDIQVYVDAWMHVWTYVCMHVWHLAHMDVYMHTCMYVMEEEIKIPRSSLCLHIDCDFVYVHMYVCVYV